MENRIKSYNSEVHIANSRASKSSTISIVNIRHFSAYKIINILSIKEDFSVNI